METDKQEIIITFVFLLNSRKLRQTEDNWGKEWNNQGEVKLHMKFYMGINIKYYLIFISLRVSKF